MCLSCGLMMVLYTRILNERHATLLKNGIVLLQCCKFAAHLNISLNNFDHFYILSSRLCRRRPAGLSPVMSGLVILKDID